MSGDAFNHLFIEPTSYDEARRFYRDKLGWQIEFEWGGDGEPRGSSITSGGMTVVLAERHSSDDRAWSHGVSGTRPTLHLMVADVEKRYAELEPSGATLFAPENTHWGTRWFVARDPDGNLIAFEQRITSSD
jgi:catechol 2,3-dioxygenase-like lactoylglutathione lyase family enzyme